MYHIVFIPKYHRKIIYGKMRRNIGTYLQHLCNYKDVEIIEANICIDNIHMLVKISPTLSILQFMVFLKCKGALMIFDNHSNLKYKHGKRTFLAKAYYVSTIGLNKQTIKKYIKN